MVPVAGVEPVCGGGRFAGCSAIVFVARLSGSGSVLIYYLILSNYYVNLLLFVNFSVIC